MVAHSFGMFRGGKWWFDLCSVEYGEIREHLAWWAYPTVLKKTTMLIKNLDITGDAIKRR